MKRIVIRLGLFIFLLVFFSGCAHLGLMDRTGEEALRQKVVKEWQAKVDQEWGTVYELTTKAYKKAIQRNSFIKRANITVKEFDIKEIKLSDTGQTAIVRVEGLIMQSVYKFNLPFTENWVIEDGQWHLELKPF